MDLQEKRFTSETPRTQSKNGKTIGVGIRVASCKSRVGKIVGDVISSG